MDLLKAIDNNLTKAPLMLRIFISLGFVVLVALGDWYSGYEIAFSVFYLIPVGCVSWYFSLRFGLLMCVLCWGVWFSLESLSSVEYSHPAIFYWNSLVRLVFFVVVAVLMARLKKEFEKLEALAQIDGLTGLLNAREFKQQAKSQFDLATRQQYPTTLGYIDLDGFKSVNDTMGHSEGDNVLMAVSLLMRNRLRSYDICARLGGDEFAVLLPDTELSSARIFFLELHKSLRELCQQHRWPVGFSVGVVVFQSVKVEVDQAIRLTDELMYKVKQSGKNNIRFETFAG